VTFRSYVVNRSTGFYNIRLYKYRKVALPVIKNATAGEALPQLQSTGWALVFPMPMVNRILR
jgi:hypothetical protein